MAVRAGTEFIERLRKTPREVWMRGERIGDVTAHPVFARPLAHALRAAEDLRGPGRPPRIVPDLGRGNAGAHGPLTGLPQHLATGVRRRAGDLPRDGTALCREHTEVLRIRP